MQQEIVIYYKLDRLIDWLLLATVEIRAKIPTLRQRRGALSLWSNAKQGLLSSFWFTTQKISRNSLS